MNTLNNMGSQQESQSIHKITHPTTLPPIHTQFQTNRTPTLAGEVSFPLQISTPNSGSPGRRVNYNGFTSWPTLPQLIIIVYYVIATVMFQTIVYFQIAEHCLITGVCISLAQFVLSILVSLYWYKTTSIDPTDPIQKLQRNLHQQQNNSQQQQAHSNHQQRAHNNGMVLCQPPMNPFFCQRCQMRTGNRSYHCSRCHRCVSFYDHHCRWLNNCIGASNYVEFLLLVACLWLEEALKIVVSASELIKQVRSVVDKQEVSLGWVGVMDAVLIALALVPFGIASQLGFIHIRILFRNRILWELILANRQSENSGLKISQKVNANPSICAGEDQSISQTPNMLINQPLGRQIQDQTKIYIRAAGIKQVKADSKEEPTDEINLDGKNYKNYIKGDTRDETKEDTKVERQSQQIEQCEDSMKVMAVLRNPSQVIKRNKQSKLRAINHICQTSDL